jgi:hypothetical protein
MYTIAFSAKCLESFGTAMSNMNEIADKKKS